MHNGEVFNPASNPNPVIMFEQSTIPSIANAAATNCASIVDMAVSV